MITHDYTQNSGNYFFKVYLNGLELFSGAGYYEQMLESVAHCKKLFEPVNFKGCFLFGTDSLAQMHLEQPFDMAYHETQSFYTGNIKREHFKVNKEYYCYIVSHGNGYFTFNEWFGGQVVPKMTDLTKAELQHFRTLGLI